MDEYLRANFTARRVFALLACIGCFALCIAVVLGWVSLGWWQTIVILIMGLLAYEWAG